MKKFVLFSLLILYLPLASNAQIVDIESKRGNLVDTSGLFGFTDLSFNLVSNTRQIISVKGAVRLEWIQNKYKILSLSNYNLIRVNDERFVNNAFQHLRYTRKLGKHLAWESFGQLQENEQIRIQLRGLLGTGPRFQLFRKKKQQIYLGVMYMYEYNEISDTTFIQRDHRLSTYLSLVLQPSSNFSISSTSYVQPEIVEPGDIRLSSTNAFRFKITNQLSFQVTFSITYDSQLSKEAEGVPSTNYQLLNGLRWDF
ncbi:MAG: DUF481 domain-containing protein [Bacteroidota bacterium]